MIIFTFSPQLDQQDAELAEVVIHTHIALSINSSNLLLQPLALFMVSPRDMKVGSREMEILEILLHLKDSTTNDDAEK